MHTTSNTVNPMTVRRKRDSIAEKRVLIPIFVLMSQIKVEGEVTRLTFWKQKGVDFCQGGEARRHSYEGRRFLSHSAFKASWFLYTQLPRPADLWTAVKVSRFWQELLPGRTKFGVTVCSRLYTFVHINDASQIGLHASISRK